MSDMPDNLVHRFELRLTTKERKALARAAKTRNMSEAAFVRAALDQTLWPKGQKALKGGT
jgi:uncharacterized protein (DUF1778 family)